MKIQFLGGAGTVTGSKYLITFAGRSIMVDCGMYQGLKELRLRNWEPFPVDPSRIEAILLTHAHLDHSGYLPLLAKNGFRGPIFATPATRDLARILLMDSAYLQEEEAKFANHQGYSKHHPAKPLYERADAERAMNQFVVADLGRQLESGPFRFEFFAVGHLLGASGIRLEARDRSVIFSGDLGRKYDPVMPAPTVPAGANALVIESTYGNRLHDDKDAGEELGRIVSETIARGGTVLIPSFAVGRAQLLLYHLSRLKKAGQIPDVPIFLNSPMANAVNAIFRRYAYEHRLGQDGVAEIFQAIRIVTTPEESRALNDDPNPKIILSASGMATGGRVLHHLKRLLPDPKNTVLFAGFQAAGTRGEALIHGKREIKIHGEMWKVRANICNMESLSAHADSAELIGWAAKLAPPPTRIFVVHGEPAAAQALAEALKSQMGSAASVPAFNDVAEI